MRYLILLLLYIVPFATTAKTKEHINFFAQYECSKSNIIAGDSIMVSVVLYCDHPFQDVNCTTKSFRVKGGHYRKVARRSQRQQQQVRLEDGVFYSVVWDRFIVGSDVVGVIQLPQLQFKGQFIVYDSDYEYEPLDPFGFFSRPTRKSHHVDASCKSPKFKLPVIARPKRSTREVLSSGGQVA